jgi:hypothetical protein
MFCASCFLLWVFCVCVCVCVCVSFLPCSVSMASVQLLDLSICAHLRPKYLTWCLGGMGRLHYAREFFFCVYPTVIVRVETGGRLPTRLTKSESLFLCACLRKRWPCVYLFVSRIVHRNCWKVNVLCFVFRNFCLGRISCVFISIIINNNCNYSRSLFKWQKFKLNGQYSEINGHYS